MPDAFGFELRDPRARRADADGDAAGVAHRAELREHEEPQAHVDGREVRDGERLRTGSFGTHEVRCYGRWTSCSATTGSGSRSWLRPSESV